MATYPYIHHLDATINILFACFITCVYSYLFLHPIISFDS